MGYHRFNEVEFLTNGVGYVSTSFPAAERHFYLDLAYWLRECVIDGKPIYKRFTPTLFYPDARQAELDQLIRPAPFEYQIDFTKTPVVAVFGALHVVCKKCFYKMNRIVCAVGSSEIEMLMWRMSFASARLHIKQYHGLCWDEEKEREKSLVENVAKTIFTHLNERKNNAGSHHTRPEPQVCRTGGANQPA